MSPACKENLDVQAGSRAHPCSRVILIGGLLLGCLSLSAGYARAQAPCPAPATSFAVTAEHHPPVVRSSYTREELRILAGSASNGSPHPPLGFYVGTFGYRIEVDTREAQECDLAVTVRLFLEPRLIEVANDGPCQPEVVAEHYLLHAREDDLLLSRTAAQARDMLDGIRRARPSEMPDKNGRGAVVHWVATAMDRLLQPYDDARKHALGAADTTAELARLDQGCSRAT